MKEKITILTPTYNRAKLLTRAYESLVNQKNKSFIWLIVDDGSTDDTENIVNNFIKEDKIIIQYFRKKNGGKHTALNYGIEKIKTELTMILDSDDKLTDDAIEVVLKDYKEYINDDKICGASYLKADLNRKVLGELYNTDKFISNHIEARINARNKSDKEEVFKTKILKKYPFPIFEGEKFLSETLIWNRIAKKYDTLYINKIIYLCEYQPDGMSKNWRKLNLKNPQGASLVVNEMSTKEFKFKVRIKNTLAYIVYSKYGKKNFYEIVKNSNSRLNTMILYIPASILTIIYKKKYKSI